jgi:hypothetical protein
MSEDFWKDVQAFIRAEIAASHKTQRIAPNTPFGSVVTDAYGHVVHGAQGGGSGLQLLAVCYKNSTQSISASTPTAINFDQNYYDPGGLVTTGASWHLTIPSDGKYLFVARISFAETGSGWSGGDYAALALYQNGFYAEGFDYLDDPQNNTLNNILRCHHVIDLNEADEVALRVEQSSSGNKTIAGGNFQNQLSVYKC